MNALHELTKNEMTRRVAILVVGILAASFVFVGGASAQAEPSIEVSVNGSPVGDTERVVVSSANLTAEISGNVSLDRVEIEVDGATIHADEPSGQDYRVELDPDFHARTNTVQVIVKGEDGGLWTHRIDIYKDTIPPDIGLTAPVSVEPGHQFPDRRTRENADIQVAGVVEDVSSIEEFSARIVGDGRSVETTRLENDTFGLNTTLAAGNNSLMIEATDEFGNRAYRRMQFEVVDEDSPSLAVAGWENRTENATVRPTVVATDAVGVTTVRYRISGQPQRTLVESPSSLFDQGRTNVTRTASLSFARAGTYNVTFNVTDVAGKSTEVTRTITYDPVTRADAAAPTVTVFENRSGLLNETHYRFSAAVESGAVRTVGVDARNRFGRVTLLETVYDGPNASTVPIELDVPVDPGRNEITINATDALGNQHERSVVVDPANASDYEAPTATTTEEPSSTTTPKAAQTTAQTTNLQVTPATPIAPETATEGPLSPVLVVVALGLAGVVALVRRGGG